MTGGVYCTLLDLNPEEVVSAPSSNQTPAIAVSDQILLFYTDDF